MNTRIVLGILFVACILMLVPSVPAVQFHTLVEMNTSQILSQQRSVNVVKRGQTVKTVDLLDLKEQLQYLVPDSFHENLFTIIYILLSLPVLIAFFIVFVVLGYPMPPVEHY